MKYHREEGGGKWAWVSDDLAGKSRAGNGITILKISDAV